MKGCTCEPPDECRWCNGEAAEDAELRQASRDERAAYFNRLARWRTWWNTINERGVVDVDT